MNQLPALGLYIHYPWCEKKCPYCDFNSHENHRPPEQAYITALLRDLEVQASYYQDRTVDTLFIGGGTPSLMSVAGLQSLFSGIKNQVELSPRLEATMEANPGSADAEKFEGFFNAGINRLSIGIQSFNPEHLSALGRIHSADQAHAAIEMAKRAGFSNINIDLMHSLPGQLARNSSSDLKLAISHDLPHLSWYQLTVEPNTVFYNRPPVLPVEEELVAIQEGGEQLIAAAGLNQYEVSAYAREQYHCRHNTNYWNFGDYLGIGAGAHGKITDADGKILRYAKKRQPGDYMNSKDIEALADRRLLAKTEMPGEFVLNALRLNRGFSLEHFRKTTGLEPTHLQPQLDQLLERQLLTDDGDRIKVTPLGARFLDAVVGEFFEN